MITNQAPKDYRRPYFIAFIFYYWCMVVMGLLAPYDFFRGQAWTGGFCDAMASIIPQIDRFAEISIEPIINRFYFSVLWATSPVLFLIVIFLYLSKPLHMHKWKQTGQPKYQSIVFLLGITTACGIWPQTLYWVYADQKLTQILLGNDLIRATLTQLIWVTGPCMALAGMPFSFAVWYIGPNNSRNPAKNETTKNLFRTFL